jgi:hypothetical protein
MFHGIWQVLNFGIYKAERISHAKRMEVEILNLIHHAHYSMEQSLKHKANRQTAHLPINSLQMHAIGPFEAKWT